MPVSPNSATTLRIIRIAFLAGVLAFGGIVTYLVGENGPSATSEVGPALEYVNIGFIVASAGAIFLLQRLHSRERDAARRRTYNILAWAAGEATALFGGVHYLLTGQPLPYLVGLAMMVASFVLVPIRE